MNLPPNDVVDSGGTASSDEPPTQPEPPLVPPPPPTAEDANLSAVAASVGAFKNKLQKSSTKRRKHIPQAIMRRRHDVWEMMCQGIPRGEMAKVLNVCEGTIGGDIRFWRKKVAHRVARMKDETKAAHIELGLTVKKLDAIVEAAFQEYSTSKSGNEKDKFLNTAAKALATKTRILQETGFLPKAGIKIEASVTQEPSFADRFGPASPLATFDDPTSRHKVLAIAERLLRLAQAQKPIDIDAVAKSVPVPQLPANGAT